VADGGEPQSPLDPASIADGGPCFLHFQEVPVCPTVSSPFTAARRTGMDSGPPSLAALSVGSTGLVRDVLGDDAVALRLLEMGLTPGVAVRLVGRAPLGDPLEFELRGYRLSLRRNDAARVVIEGS
jgi:ferrous iron transport protein A